MFQAYINGSQFIKWEENCGKITFANWQIFIQGLIFFTFSWLSRTLSNNQGPGIYTFLLCFGYCIQSLLLTKILKIELQLPKNKTIAFLFNGLAGGISFILWVSAIQQISLFVAQLIFAINPFIAMFTDQLINDEKMTKKDGVFCFISFIGIGLACYGAFSDNKQSSFTWIGLHFFNILLITLASSIVKNLQHVNVFNYVCFDSAFKTLCALLFAIFMKEFAHTTWRSWQLLFLLGGFFLMIVWVMFFRGLQIGKPVYCWIIVNSKVVFAFLVDIIFQDMKFNWFLAIGSTIVILCLLWFLCTKFDEKSTSLDKEINQEIKSEYRPPDNRNMY